MCASHDLTFQITNNLRSSARRATQATTMQQVRLENPEEYRISKRSRDASRARYRELIKVIFNFLFNRITRPIRETQSFALGTFYIYISSIYGIHI